MQHRVPGLNSFKLVSRAAPTAIMCLRLLVSNVTSSHVFKNQKLYYVQEILDWHHLLEDPLAALPCGSDLLPSYCNLAMTGVSKGNEHCYRIPVVVVLVLTDRGTTS